MPTASPRDRLNNVRAQLEKEEVETVKDTNSLMELLSRLGEYLETLNVIEGDIIELRRGEKRSMTPDQARQLIGELDLLRVRINQIDKKLFWYVSRQKMDIKREERTIGEYSRLNNRVAAERFLKVSALVLWEKGSPRALRFRRSGTKLKDQIAIADFFNLCGVIHNTRHHARLVLEVKGMTKVKRKGKLEKEGRLLVYDPVMDGSPDYIYPFVPGQESEIGVTTSLAKFIPGFAGKGKPIILSSDNAKYPLLMRSLIGNGYHLSLPSTKQLHGLQNTSQMVCGPLAVYAMAIANRYTPPYNRIANFDLLKAKTGIEIV